MPMLLMRQASAAAQARLGGAVTTSSGLNAASTAGPITGLPWMTMMRAGNMAAPVTPLYGQTMLRMFSAMNSQANKAAGAKRPTNYGQTKMNFNGPTYRTTRGAGHAAAMAEQKTWLPFAANSLWDAPGARRIAKRLGRGPGSGKG